MAPQYALDYVAMRRRGCQVVGHGNALDHEDLTVYLDLADDVGMQAIPACRDVARIQRAGKSAK